MHLWYSLTDFFGGHVSWSSAKAASSLAMAVVFAMMSAAAELAHPSIPFLIALVCIDFALAAGIAIYDKRFSCAGFRHGLGKFIGYSLAFIVTTLADKGMSIDGWPLNITVAMSCWAITGEAISCLGHINHIFPKILPPWIIVRLQSVHSNIGGRGMMGAPGGGIEPPPVNGE